MNVIPTPKFQKINVKTSFMRDCEVPGVFIIRNEGFFIILKRRNIHP